MALDGGELEAIDRNQGAVKDADTEQSQDEDDTEAAVNPVSVAVQAQVESGLGSVSWADLDLSPSPSYSAASVSAAINELDALADEIEQLTVSGAAARTAALDVVANDLGAQGGPPQAQTERSALLSRVTGVRDWSGWVIGAVGTGFGVGVGIYDLVHSAQHKTPSPFQGDVTPAVAQAIDNIVTTWNSLPEDQFWARVQGFVTDDSPSIAVQVVMMNDIVNLSQPAPISWTGDQKQAAVQSLVDAWQAAGAELVAADFAALYGAAATLTFTSGGSSQPVPRISKADCCRYALGQILLMPLNG